MTTLSSTQVKVIGIASGIGVAIFSIIFASRVRTLKHKFLSKSLMEALQKPTVHMKDPSKVESMIRTFINGGHKRLQVVADWDRTITGFYRDGRVVETCHHALDKCKHLPDYYQKEATEMRDHYMAIEFDPNRTVEEKYPYMVEWWTKAHDLLVKCNLTRNTIRQIVAESNILLRIGCEGMFKELHKADIPLLIFSAGIGDVIEEVIKQQVTLYDNMRIVSNYMDFNSQGSLVGWQGDLIHTFNKNESAIHKSDYFPKIVHRDNVILMGDTIGDLRMADGCAKDANVLKIGFLNDKVDQLLPSYLDAYDVVLVKDETMDVPNAIFKQVL